MFNGIIYKQGKIKKISRLKKSFYLEISSNLRFTKKEIGSSISCNGVCLTLTKVSKNSIFFYLSHETLKRSNFKYIRIGDHVNLEKSIKYGQRISGHYVQGHVDTTGMIKKISIVDRTWILNISIPKKFQKLLTIKGSISINGVSLTISNTNKNSFQISVIPHTLSLTNLLNLKKKNFLNIEFDIMNKYLLKINS